MTRTALGHSDWQEFAFPCSACGVEIRFGMNLNQSKPDFSYEWIRGAEWLNDGLFPVVQKTHNSDGENLIPKALKSFSPFMETNFLSKNPTEFRNHQHLRFLGAQEFWPKVRQLQVHFERNSEALFDTAATGLGYTGALVDRESRVRAQMWCIEVVGSFFRPLANPEITFVKQRIHLAEAKIGSALPMLVSVLSSDTIIGHYFLNA